MKAEVKAFRQYICPYCGSKRIKWGGQPEQEKHETNCYIEHNWGCMTCGCAFDVYYRPDEIRIREIEKR